MIITKISVNLLIPLQLFHVGILDVNCTTETSIVSRYEDLNDEISPLTENDCDSGQPPSYADSIKKPLRIIKMTNEHAILDLGENKETARSEHISNERKFMLACAIFLCSIAVFHFITVGLIFCIINSKLPVN
ncbi:hypothetical protein NBO_24g0016 [Nosema bombycis CQ1]|uniref:Uncharacterized protein n=1 Tax=Nosema bombycis (strain CQ1 / CVCC 102059) TaxID=578461 RepID=R0MK09_NOSB1|nr:hypothetical protein NBO_24g0016 [Nosema bombycis CQ1]|eukprot:EOB14570.1 hypothetical protein NBO_24g0016 [Nosema bombycis CQ1]